MKIKNRLLLAYLANTLVVCLFGFFAYQSNQQTQQEYQLLSQQSIPVLDALNEVRFNALRIISSTSEAGLISHLKVEKAEEEAEASHSVDEREEELAEEGESQLQDAVNHYTALVHRFFPDEVEFATEIQQQADRLQQLSVQFFAALEAHESPDTLLELKEQLEEAEREFLAISRQALNYEAGEIQERSVEVTGAIAHNFQTLLIGVFTIMLITALMTLHMGKNIALPVARLRDAAHRIAEGDLSVRVPLRSEDELGELSQAFNRMSDKLTQHKNQLEEAHDYTENILHVMEDILIATDAMGVIQKVNRATCEQLGYSEPELLGHSVNLLLENQGAPLSHFIPVDKDGHFERNLRNREGHRVPVLASLNHIEGKDTQRVGYLLVATNISARKLAEEKIHKLAFYDSLSGLPNRTLFNDRLNQAIKFARRQEHHLAVLFIDLDNFKQINDSLGHDVGDGLLREVSERLVQALRESDVVAHENSRLMAPTVSRHGGDEFLILLPYINEPLDAGKVAERIQQRFNRALQVKMQEIFTSLSIGIAVYPENGNDGRLLVQNADTALYSAKASGKNQFCYFEAEMNSSALRRLDVENNLRHALGKQEFRLYYQPQLDLDSGRVVGMEALIRWHHNEWGVVSPLEFIPVAESSGMILAIGDWVLREACTQWSQWKGEGLDPGKMSVNLSALQFRDDNLCDKVKSVIRETGIDPDALVLEITESVLMQDAESTLSQLRNIKALGVRFAVDDFGTGYSSLSYLKTFPLDYLKIDRAFVRDLESSESDLEIVRTIIAMAKNLRLQLVAEGVETPGQLRILQAQNCHYMQGFILSRPVDAAEYRSSFLAAQEPTPDSLQLCRDALAWQAA